MSGVETRLRDIDSALAETAPLPRSNGELVFEEPWQGRALGMTVVALEHARIPWSEFSNRLAEAVRQHGYDPDEPAAAAYYAAWLDALEATLGGAGADLR
jgi:nitrile hydratase accessory protein